MCVVFALKNLPFRISTFVGIINGFLTLVFHVLLNSARQISFFIVILLVLERGGREKDT